MMSSIFYIQVQEDVIAGGTSLKACEVQNYLTLIQQDYVAYQPATLVSYSLHRMRRYSTSTTAVISGWC
jgi:hypothetical protein